MTLLLPFLAFMFGMLVITAGAMALMPRRASAIDRRIEELVNTERQEETRPRLAFMAKTPQAEAGIRSEPPPSFPCAAGTMPTLTAAALPPDDPPALREGSYGFRVGARTAGSVVPRMPSSGVFVLPTQTSSASRRANLRISGLTSRS